jgi:hypothetical protein
MNRLILKRSTTLVVAALLGLGLAQFSVAAPSKNALGIPNLTVLPADESTQLDATVCASPITPGAPFGFSLQWMTTSDYAANNNAWYLSSDPRLCKASFAGKANGSNFNLAAGACAPTIVIGSEISGPAGATSFNCGDTLLTCGTTYMVRTFAHAGTSGKTSYQQSGFSTPVEASTAACDQTTCRAKPINGLATPSACVSSQGFWKTHSMITAGNNPLPDYWPTGFSLEICGVTYGTFDLVSAMQGTSNDANSALFFGKTKPPNLVIQYIAGMLNFASGSPEMQEALTDALATAQSYLTASTCDPLSEGGAQAGADLDAMQKTDGSLAHCDLICQ